MAFGFDDFAKLFDPVSDLLGTSGKKGVGLLQQDPEDLAMLAALAAGGYGALTAVPGATGIAAAGPSAALVTPEVAALAPEVASLGAEEATRLAAEETARIAAQEAAQRGILQTNQMDPGLLSDVNARGIQTADTSTNYLQNIRDMFKKPVDLDSGTNMSELSKFNQASLDSPMAQKSAYTNLNPNLSGLENQIDLINKGPGYTDYLNDTSAKSLSKGISFEDYQLDQARRAAAEGAKLPSTVDMSLGRQSVPDYTSFADSFHKSSITPDRFQNLEGLRVPDNGPYQIESGDYLNNSPKTESAFDIGRKAGEYFDKALKYTETDPYKSAALAYYGAYKTGMLDQKPVEAPVDDYKNPYSMRNFRRSSPAPDAYRYTPRYAEGGIASVQGYKKGGRSKTEAAMDFYDAMNPQRESAPLSHGSPGIYYDSDPDTRYLDPMEAAMVRMSKLNSRANVQAPTMTPARRMGELDFKPVAAAQGGIMGYADGGMPLEDDMYIRLTGRNDRADRMPGPDAPFSPTSEGAAAVSKFGQGMKDYPAIAPGGLAAQVIGSIASAYGDHMARNVDPNYGHEGMNTTAGKTFDVPTISADDDNSAVLGLNGSGGASVSSSDFGGGSFDPAGRDSDGTPLAKGGGIMGYSLGGYAAGGNPRLLRGPGDGMSDNIPATINNRQPARLADGEYVITADVVSHLGNGSTEAGARQLDAMMKRIRKGRTGTSKQGKQINPRKYLPA